MPVKLVRETIPNSEREYLIRHLEADTGAGKHYALLLREGADLQEFEVFPLLDVGELVTFFKNIGTLTSIEAAGTQFFPLRLAYAAFKRASEKKEENPMKPDFRIIQEYVQRIQESGTQGKVTAVKLGNENYQLVDGNKSAIAAYEWARASGRIDFGLRFYVIS